MDNKPALRRLLKLPGVAGLEYKALMKRDFAEPEARAQYPEIDACSRELFGLTAEEAEQLARTGVDLGILGAGLGLGEVTLHQRLVLEAGDAGELEQAAQGGLVVHAGA